MALVRRPVNVSSKAKHDSIKRGFQGSNVNARQQCTFLLRRDTRGHGLVVQPETWPWTLLSVPRERAAHFPLSYICNDTLDGHQFIYEFYWFLNELVTTLVMRFKTCSISIGAGKYARMIAGHYVASAVCHTRFCPPSWPTVIC